MAYGKTHDPDEALSALKSINPSDLTQDGWLKLTMAAKSAGVAFEDWDAWCRRDRERYDERENLRRWDSVDPSKPGGVTEKTLFAMARKCGWRGSAGIRPLHAPRRATQLREEFPRLVLPEAGGTVPSLSEFAKLDPAEQLRRYMRALHGEDTYVVLYLKGGPNPRNPAKPSPIGRGELWRVGDLIDRAGDPLGRVDRSAGAWVTVNEVDPEGFRERGRKADIAASYRYALIEADEAEDGSPMTLEAQAEMATRLRLPAAAAVWSGGKSLHLICRVDADGPEQYRARVEYLMGVCRANGFNVDTNNKDALRLTRLPGATRGDGQQTFLGANNPTKCTFDAWTRYVDEHAACERVDERRGWLVLSDYIGANLPEPEPDLIDGLLGYGEKSIIYGASKAGKSWLSMYLAFALASGARFLGHQVGRRPGTVFYLNLEIKDDRLRERFDRIRRAGDWGEGAADHIRWLPKREALGISQTSRDAVNDLLRQVKPGDFVIIDCLYMLLAGQDENAASTMQPIVRDFDRLIEEGRCSGVWIVHHQAKGASGQKSVADRGAGSGVLSRYVDNIFSLDYLDADEDDEFVGQAETEKLYPRRLSYVLRNVESDGDSIDFLFGGPRIVPDGERRLSRYYVSGSPQANGAHSTRSNRERAEQDWAAKAELVGAALEEAAREGASPTPEYVSAYYAAHHGESGLGKGVGLGTIRNWLKPGCTSLPFHTEGGVVVPDESGGEGQ